MVQTKLALGTSLEGSDIQIKLRMIKQLADKSCLSQEDLVMHETGLTLNEYLNRPFNRLMYAEYRRQCQKFLYPKIKYWEL